MARVSSIVTSFRAGEISPKLEGRIDLEKYNEAAQTLSNMLVYPSGGVTRRPGTYFAGRSKDGGQVRLINFEYSDEQAYVLEFGNNYIRFYKDGGLLTEASQTITAITKANPAVVTITSHPFTNGDRIFVSGVVGMTQVNNREFTVAGATTNTFQLSGIDSSGFDTYTSGGTAAKIVEVTTTYTTAQLAEINHAQSADVVYLAQKDHAPAKLTRTSATSFSLSDIDFVDGPYLDENITSTTLYASAQTGNITVTASAALFTSADIGRYIRFRDVLEITHDEWKASTSYNNNDTVRYNGHVYKQVTGSTQTSGNTPPVHTEGTETYGTIDWAYQHDDTGYVEITGFTSSTVVSATVKTDDGGIAVLPDQVIGAANATKRWSLGAFGGDQGYPKAVGFYEQRLYFAGTTGQPQSIFGSVSADFENHTPGVEDDDAVNVTIASDQVNVIKHLLPGRFLQILTTSSEFTLSGGTGATPVTPTNVNVLRETTFGSSTVRPVRAGNSTILIQKGQEKVKEITFDLDTDGLLGIDLTVLADHIPRGGLIDMTWQQEPELILWFVHNDGRLVGLTYDRANAAIAWHDHSIGGSGIVESIASIPSGAEDQVYIAVKRTIDGATVRHIEYIKSIEFGDNVDDGFFVDSGLTYDGGATTTITGLNHLEGATVAILADGATHADKTVTDGKVTLDRSSSKVHIGFGYNSIVETLRIEAGADDGVSQGKIKRIHGVTARFYKTVGAEIGPDLNNLDRVPFRDSSMAMNEAVPIFTGDKEIYFPSGYETDARVVIRQSQPLPMTVLAIMRRSNTFDA
ncbi:MAG: phage tail tube protein [Pelagibacteraceae bacterium]